MGILRASYLKQNIGGNVDIFLQNKRKRTSTVVVCRPCSRKWRILANIGDFEGLAFGVYLSVIRERQLVFQNFKIGQNSPFTATRSAYKSFKFQTHCLGSLWFDLF